jgi:hypothetical protein
MILIGQKPGFLLFCPLNFAVRRGFWPPGTQNQAVCLPIHHIKFPCKMLKMKIRDLSESFAMWMNFYRVSRLAGTPPPK